MKMLNVACGSRYHREWVNIDFAPASDLVKKVNVLEGLPFDNDSFDVVYSSHFLEHLSPEQAKFFLRECYRVLKPGGIIRIVVPDLENICREYLRILNLALNDEKYEKFYDWIVIELLDQLVRVESGGNMLKFFSWVHNSKDEELALYIKKRIGEEVLSDNMVKSTQKKITIDKMKNKVLYLYLKFIRLLIPKSIRDLVFVNTPVGERHQWMYDRYSLTRILKNTGFKDIEIMSYNTSNIPNFNSYLLDINEDGTPYKGESSLYIEAKK